MADPALRRIIATGTPLEAWQRAALGGPTAQLRIPLRDKVDLARVAAILRDLANKLEVASVRRDHSDFDALMAARAHIKLAQAKVTSQTSLGKPVGK